MNSAELTKELKQVGIAEARAIEPEPRKMDDPTLPEAVQLYLRFMGATAAARDASLLVEWSGRFRMHPRRRWMKVDAIQYNTSVEVARYWKMRLRFGGVVPIIARDTYVHGKGRMVGRLFDLITVVDATGPELDTGELVTFLNDAILLAPSMLLDQRASWLAVDERSFDVTLTDGGRSVGGRVFLDERGAVRDFSTTDRFVQDPYDPKHRFVRTRWSTPIDGWRSVNGRQVLTGARAIWHLPQGDFTYAEMKPKPGSLAFNVVPRPRSR